jgi:hypothetical protein
MEKTGKRFEEKQCKLPLHHAMELKQCDEVMLALVVAKEDTAKIPYACGVVPLHKIVE